MFINHFPAIDNIFFCIFIELFEFDINNSDLFK